jgi:GT2 family glycosyltransferase
MLCFLDGQDQWAPGALSLAANVLAQYPHLDLLFADEDWLDAEGQRERPFFKPGWDPELQRGRDLVGPFAFFRTALVRAATVSDDAAWHYDLANQVAAATRPERIHHIPAILCHRTALPPGHAQAMQAAAAQLQRDGVATQVIPVRGQPEWQRIIYDISGSEPLVSVVIPTRDRADLLITSADGVLNHTAYPRLELLIVDNGTAEPDALALLDTLAADDRVRILRRPGPFNWSVLNNAAANEAAGEVLVLLNNDVAVLQPDWLTELVSHALQPCVGAVGAKLLYQDGRVQHAGLTTDHAGIPRHLFRYAPEDSTGAYGMLGLAREVWAVTGACLAIPRRAFFDVGGLNEALPVAYNDVDLCLRLTAHGYRIIWSPWSVVEHREMASRPPDHSAGRRDQAKEERNRLLRDWGNLVMHDPFLNPNLHLVDEHPCLQSTPALMV